MCVIRIMYLLIKMSKKKKNLSSTCPPFGYQTIEIMTLKELKFPQESPVRRRKRLKAGVSQKRNFSPRKKFRTVGNLSNIIK